MFIWLTFILYLLMTFDDSDVHAELTWDSIATMELPTKGENSAPPLPRERSERQGRGAPVNNPNNNCAPTTPKS